MDDSLLMNIRPCENPKKGLSDALKRAVSLSYYHRCSHAKQLLKAQPL